MVETFQGYLACSIGRNKPATRSHLEKLISHPLTVREGLFNLAKMYAFRTFLMFKILPFFKPLLYPNPKNLWNPWRAERQTVWNRTFVDLQREQQEICNVSFFFLSFSRFKYIFLHFFFLIIVFRVPEMISTEILERAKQASENAESESSDEEID